MPESFAGHVREKYLDGDNNFYSALAVEFTRIGMPLKSKSTFGPTFGNPFSKVALLLTFKIEI
jgi:hypothetical protein